MSTDNDNSLVLQETSRLSSTHLASREGKRTTSNAIIDLPAVGYVRQSQLIPTIVPFSSATLWRRVNSGGFPRPVKLSERVTAWRVEDIRAWMNDRRA